VAWWMLRGSISIGGASGVATKACDVTARGPRGKRSRGTCVTTTAISPGIGNGGRISGFRANIITFFTTRLC
jgi:hypothetical protein